MSIPRPMFAWLASVVLFMSAPADAAITLVPVQTGLASPLFVTNAGDGSNRLFVLERAGIIEVVSPVTGTPAVFLDIRSRIASGGEQGLLGLAFHPLYAANGRFFVYYTRTGDGALTIAEYQVSSNPDVAGTGETVILTIPHPGATNHNGGMLAFGADGYLYAGTGDGGASNDPPNNAQNLAVLLGKILRLDIDPPVGSGVPYLSPASNPFYGAVPGRDEIFAYGLRNPWRFSFDRLTGQQWVGDVGQGSDEEVDTPIVSGGNYGWRVYEGFGCTGLDPALCTPSNFIMPILEYGHGGGRCSLTGGYVYRGAQLALPQGTYVYADYCSGEIFAWDGTAQTVLLDTSMKISSFGEDEQGELYVIDLNGTVSQLAAVAPCGFVLSTNAQAMPAAGGTASVSVATSPACTWASGTDESWLHVVTGTSGQGAGMVTYTVDPNPSASPRTGVLVVADAGQNFIVTQDGLAGATVTGGSGTGTGTVRDRARRRAQREAPGGGAGRAVPVRPGQ